MPSVTTSTQNESLCFNNSKSAASPTPAVFPQCVPILPRYEVSNYVGLAIIPSTYSLSLTHPLILKSNIIIVINF